MGIDTGPVLVLGGRSEIGTAVAVRLAALGCGTFVLAARRATTRTPQEAALRAPGATTVAGSSSTPTTSPVTRRARRGRGARRRAATVVVAFGVLGDQAAAERDPAAAVAILHTDYTAQVHVLTLLAERLRAAGRGTLVVFSSVAGVRVRRANYVYGSARRGSTASPAGWPTPWPAPASGCCSSGPASSSAG